MEEEGAVGSAPWAQSTGRRRWCRRGRGWRRKRAAGDDGGGGLVLRGPFAVWVDAERGVVVAAVACYFLGQEGWFVEGLIGRRQFYFG